MAEQKSDEKTVRVLHVLGTTNLGGAESRIMELYRCIDRNRVQFDFLIHTREDGHYSEEIRSLGGHIYSLPRFKFFNIVQYRRAIHTFFKEHTEFTAYDQYGIYLSSDCQKGICQTVITVNNGSPRQKCRGGQGTKRHCNQNITFPFKEQSGLSVYMLQRGRNRSIWGKSSQRGKSMDNSQCHRYAAFPVQTGCA